MSSQTCQEEIAEQIFDTIVNSYFSLFKEFEVKFDELCLTD